MGSLAGIFGDPIMELVADSLFESGVGSDKEAHWRHDPEEEGLVSLLSSSFHTLLPVCHALSSSALPHPSDILHFLYSQLTLDLNRVMGVRYLSQDKEVVYRYYIISVALCLQVQTPDKNT